MISKRNLLVLSLSAVLAACGGGGGDTTTENKTSFVTADFSGKYLYYVSKSSYQLAYFNADGSVLASDQLTNGEPVLNSLPGSWSVVNGELLIEFQGSTQKYTLISDDEVNRYYKIKKTSNNGNISTVGWFYDQVTGLGQAQNFVATNQIP